MGWWCRRSSLVFIGRPDHLQSLAMVEVIGASERDLRHYLRVLRRRKWAVLAVVAVITLLALGMSLLQTPLYQASADLLIKEPARSSGSVFNQQSQAQTDASIVIGTQIEIITSRPVREAVARQLGLAPSVSVREVGQTEVVEVKASSIHPKMASAVANAWANAYIDFTRSQDMSSDLAASTQIQAKVSELSKQIDAVDTQVAAATALDRPTVLANLGPQRDSLVTQQGLFRQRLDQLQVDSSLRTGAAELVTSAETPTSPSTPRPIRSTLLGIAVGLLIGIGQFWRLWPSSLCSR